MSDLTYNSNLIPAVSTATNVIFVRKDGDDLNDGSSHEKAKVTIGSAISEAISKSPSSANRFNIFVIDSAIYEEDVVLQPFVDLEAKCAIIKSVGGTALEFTNDTIVGLLGVEVSSGGIGLKYDTSSSNVGNANISKIECSDTSDGIVCLEGESSISVDNIDVETGNGIRLSNAGGPFASSNSHNVSFKTINVTGIGKAIQVNGTFDECFATGALIKSPVSGALAVDMDSGFLEYSCCKLDLPTGKKWNISSDATFNFVGGNVTRANIANEFVNDGNVSAFICNEQVKIFNAQTTGSSLVEVYRVTLEEGDMCGFFIEAKGLKDDGTEACYQNVQNAFVRETGLGARRVSSQDGSGLRDSDDSQYKIQFTVSGNDAIISVTGRVNETVNWDIQIREARKDG